MGSFPDFKTYRLMTGGGSSGGSGGGFSGHCGLFDDSKQTILESAQKFRNFQKRCYALLIAVLLAYFLNPLIAYILPFGFDFIPVPFCITFIWFGFGVLMPLIKLNSSNVHFDKSKLAEQVITCRKAAGFGVKIILLHALAMLPALLIAQHLTEEYRLHDFAYNIDVDDLAENCEIIVWMEYILTAILLCKLWIDYAIESQNILENGHYSSAVKEICNVKELNSVFIFTNKSLDGWYKIIACEGVKTPHLYEPNLPLDYELFAVFHTPEHVKLKQRLLSEANEYSSSYCGRRTRRDFVKLSQREATNIVVCIAKEMSNEMEGIRIDEKDGHFIVCDMRPVPPFRFSMCGIKAGEQMVWLPTARVVNVVSDDSIEYKGKTYVLPSAQSCSTEARAVPDDLKNLCYKDKCLETLWRECGRQQK